MKRKTISYGRKIVIDIGDRYRTTHLETYVEAELEEDDDVDACMAELESDVDGFLAVKAVEIKFGDTLKKVTTLRAVEIANNDVKNFLGNIGLGNISIEI